MFSCEKCSSMSIDVIYIPPLEFKDSVTPEFLRCSCSGCGYTWAEEPGAGKKK